MVIPMTILQEHPNPWAEIEEYKRVKAELEIKSKLLELHDPLPQRTAATSEH